MQNGSSSGDAKPESELSPLKPSSVLADEAVAAARKSEAEKPAEDAPTATSEGNGAVNGTTNE